jgi:hypothetical protein
MQTGLTDLKGSTYVFKKKKKNTYLQARHWWLGPIILATWGTEIGRIVFRDQPKQIV